VTGPGLRTLAELVRAPAALTVPGDVLAGAAAVHRPLSRPVAGLAAGSICLYWAGMALNDYADRDLDRVERPERPIPSGRVTPGFALGLAAGLTGAGIACAGLSGGRPALGVAVPLAATVWLYDLVAKDTPAGPVVMAAARGLNVLMGSGPARAGLLPAGAVAAHTVAVTVLSRGEVHGTRCEVPLATLAGSGAVAALAGAARRPAAAVLAAAYLAAVGGAQSAAVQQPTPGRVRRAVGAGILGFIPLQAALIARTGPARTALAVAAAHPLARALARRNAVT
jgi:4-hydroxybenzoate polyprenyltransferase